MSFKTCTKCKQEQPVSEFYARADKTNALQSWCKGCNRERKRAWAKANPEKRREAERRWKKANPDKANAWARNNREKIRENQRRIRREHPERRRATIIKSRYGISLAEYDALIAGACAICGATDRTMHLDHCHETGQVRDALCNLCNKGLGCFADSPERMRDAAGYVEAHQKEAAA